MGGRRLVHCGLPTRRATLRRKRAGYGSIRAQRRRAPTNIKLVIYHSQNNQGCIAIRAEGTASARVTLREVGFEPATNHLSPHHHTTSLRPA